MSDPNLAALTIQLAMDDSAALASFDKLASRAIELEKEVQAAAQSAVGSIKMMGDELQTQFDKAYLSVQTVNAGVADLNTALKGVTSGFAGINIDDTQLQRLTDHTDRLVEWVQHYKDIAAAATEIDKSTTSITKNTIRMNRALAATNQQLSAQSGPNAPLSSVQTMLNGILARWRSINGATGDATSATLLNKAAIGAVLYKLREVSAEAENFVTVNYRAYGSMTALTQRTRELSATSGILRKEAIDAYKALADVQTPTASLDRLAAAVAHAGRETGVSAQSWAGYVQVMRVAGRSTAEQLQSITALTEAQRKHGLTVQMMNDIIVKSTTEAARVTAMYGRNAIETYQRLSIEIRKFQQQGQIFASTADEMQSALTASGIQAEYFFNVLGGAGNLLDRRTLQVQQRAAAGFMEQMNLTVDSLENMNAVQRQVYEDLAKQLTPVSLATIIDIVKGQQRAAQAAAEAGTVYGQLSNALHALGDDFVNVGKIWSSSNDNLYRQMTVLGQQLLVLWGYIEAIFGPPFVFVLKVLNSVISVIFAFVNAIKTLWGWLENLGDIIRDVYRTLGPLPIAIQAIVDALGFFGDICGTVVKAVRIVIQVIIGLAVVIALLDATIGTFVMNQLRRLLVLRGAVAGTAAFFNGLITSTLAFFGTILPGFAVAVGTALRTLGTMVMEVALPLLAVGTAFAAAGAGAWLLVRAVHELIDMDWTKAALGILFVSAALGVLTAAALSMATATVSIPVLLTIAAVVLAIGAAAWMMGLGVAAAADALARLHQAAVQPGSPPLYLVLPMIAAGLAMVGVAALIGAPGFLALAGAMWALHAAGTPILQLFDRILGLFDGTEENAAGPIAATAASLKVAAFDVLAAGTALVTGAAVLAAGLVSLQGVSILAIPAAVALGVAAWAIGLAGGRLLVGSEPLLTGAQNVAAAGSALTTGAPAVAAGSEVLLQAAATATIAGDALVIAGPRLQTGVLALSTALFLLLPTAALAEVTGGMLERGGTAIAQGAVMVSVGAELLNDAGPLLAAGANSFWWAQTSLAMLGASLGFTASLLTHGGIALYTAALILHAATTHVHDAGVEVQAGTMLLAASGAELRSFAIGLPAAAAMLMAGAVALVPAGVALIAGAASLRAGIMAMAAVAGQAAPVVDDLNALAGATSAAATGAERLSAALITLAGADADLGLTAATMALERQAALMEAAAARLEAAVLGRAVPAMMALDRPGLEQAIKAETVHTVKVYTEEDRANEGNANTDLLREHTDLLQRVADGIEANATGQTRSDRLLSQLIDLFGEFVASQESRDSDSPAFGRWGS